MHADEQTSNARRRHFRLVERDKTDEGANPEAGDETHDEEHADVHGTGLQSAADDRYDRVQEQ